ncbi:MAG TPA: hypothetical protein DDY98_00240 [Ruminococcaceae bacterium]|nr:hypothetical protein [Oscillospiraceae bacterium]
MGCRRLKGCISLTSITIPRSVTNIDFNRFGECWALTSLVVDPENTVYDSRNNCNAIIETESNTLLFGCNSTIIPDSITSIADSAFICCEGLTSVTIPNGVVSIEDGAFQGCKRLTSITIPSSVTSIGSYAFYSCTGLKTAGPIGGGYNIEFGWDLTIPGSAFQGCTGLTSITIPSSVMSIGGYAFSGCTGLKDVYYLGTQGQWEKVTIGSSNTSLTNATVHFTEVSPLTFELSDDGESYSVSACDESASGALIIPSTYCGKPVTSIGESAFYGCTGLTSITIPDSVTNIGSNAFYNTLYYNTGSNWDNNVLYIGNHLIEAKTSVSGSYTIKSDTITIAGNAFYNRAGLTSIIIPNSVKSIGDSAFWGCTGLTGISIPSSVTSIGSVAFSYCYNLEEIYIGAGLKETGWGAFFLFPDGIDDISAKLQRFTVSSDNPYFSSDESGVLFNKNKTELLQFPFGKSGEYSVPNTVKSIGYVAFTCCTGLTSITIPNSVTSIGDWAFSDCTGLKDVYYTGTQERWNAVSISSGNDCLTSATVHFSDESSLTFELNNDGESYSVSDCDESASGALIIPSTYCGKPVTSIGYGAFGGCTGLTSITIPSSVTSIGECAFGGCTGLTSVTIPNSVTNIESAAFYGCSSLSLIKGYAGSAGIKYAVENGIPYEILDKITASVNSSMQFDYEKGLTYGFALGQNDMSALIAPNGCCLETCFDRVATGSKIRILDANNNLVNEYEAVVFGDINGDSWYDGTDAYFVYLVANGLISADALTEAQRTACDANHDGVINADDAKLIEKAGVLLNQINQNATPEELSTNSAYIEYCGLIDQTVELNEITPEAQPDSDSTAAATPEPQPTAQSILGWFRMVFTIVLNWLTRIF